MKIIKIAGIAILAVVAVTALAMVFGIPVGFLASSISSKVEAATGYRMEIAGGTKIVFRPSLSLRIGSFSLIDDNGRAHQRRLTAEGARIGVSTFSLFSGHPRLTEIAIVQPTFFSSLQRERAASSARPAARDGGAGISSDVTIDRIAIEDGTVVLSNDRDAIETRLTHIDLAAKLSKPDDAVEVRVTARANEHTLGLSIRGKIPAQRLEGQSIPLEFTFEAPGLLQDLVPGVAELKIKGSSIALNGLTGTIGQSKFAGWSTVDFSGKPMVRMSFDFQRISIAEAQPNASTDPPGKFDQPWSDKPFSLTALNFVDAEMQFSATELKIDRYRFAPISVVAILSDGVLRGAVTRTNGYGGQIQGTMLVDATGREPSHALRIDLVGIQALPFLSDVAGFTHLDGRMTAKIDARGRGNSQRAIMSSLNGAMDLRFQDGEIRGVNVADMVRTLAASIINGWNESGSKATDLSELSALFRMEGGRASTDNFRLVGPLVRVTGAGTVDVGAKTLQFKLDPKLVTSLDGQGGSGKSAGFGVPVVVQGAWSSPRIYPEIAGILDNPDGAFGKLKDLGSGLFGSGSGQGNSSGNSLLKGFEGLMGPKDSGRSSPRSQDTQSRDQDTPSRTQDSPPRDKQNQFRDRMRDKLGR